MLQTKAASCSGGMHHICLRHGFNSFFSWRDGPSRRKSTRRSPPRPSAPRANAASNAHSLSAPASKRVSPTALPCRRRVCLSGFGVYAPTATTAHARRPACATTPSCVLCNHRLERPVRRASQGLPLLDRTAAAPALVAPSTPRLSLSSPPALIRLVPRRLTSGHTS